MTVREYAKSVGFEVVGKLTRHPENEYGIDYFGEKYWIGKSYMDEADNEYIVGKRGICIVTADGGVVA